MAVCQHPFSTQVQLSPSPLWSGVFIVVAGPPTSTLFLRFDQPMDQASVPGPGIWECLIDGILKPLSNPTWDSATVLLLDYSGVAPSVSGSLEQIGLDPLLRGVNGSICRPVQFDAFYP